MNDDFEDIQAFVRNMHAARISYEAACQSYLAACVARNWPLADSLRDHVSVAAEAAMDAVALVYRRMEIAEQR